MHPEIEKLIDLSLADGEVTEKEREIIFRKAEKLGLDSDEVEMILEGKLNQLKTKKSQQNQNTKQGVIKKCPHCGAPAKSLIDKCESCGEDFRFNTLTNLNENLTMNNDSNVLKISRQNIPINKEELIEFATYSFGNANNRALNLTERNAWYSKFTEAKSKLKLAYEIDYDPFKSEISSLHSLRLKLDLEKELKGELEDDSKTNFKNPGIWIGLVMGILVMYGMYKIIMYLIK
jgi:hypothetical protein